MDAMWIGAGGGAVIGIGLGFVLARRSRLGQKTERGNQQNLEAGVRSDAPSMSASHNFAPLILGITVLAVWVANVLGHRVWWEVVSWGVVGAAVGFMAASWWTDRYPPRE
jgi:hypothetical protein